ncbi:hypothetical protein KIL84_001627, partial [Mauremys mutica]
MSGSLKVSVPQRSDGWCDEDLEQALQFDCGYCPVYSHEHGPCKPKRAGTGALRAPTLYLSETSAREGDSVLFWCSVISQAPACRVVFCKDKEEILSQTSSEEKVTYDYDHEVSRGSTGKYACGYEIKDSYNRVNRSQLSSAKHLRIT